MYQLQFVAIADLRNSEECYSGIKLAKFTSQPAVNQCRQQLLSKPLIWQKASGVT